MPQNKLRWCGLVSHRDGMRILYGRHQRKCKVDGGGRICIPERKENALVSNIFVCLFLLFCTFNKHTASVESNLYVHILEPNVFSFPEFCLLPLHSCSDGFDLISAHDLIDGHTVLLFRGEAMLTLSALPPFSIWHHPSHSFLNIYVSM